MPLPTKWQLRHMFCWPFQQEGCWGCSVNEGKWKTIWFDTIFGTLEVKFCWSSNHGRFESTARLRQRAHGVERLFGPDHLNTMEAITRHILMESVGESYPKRWWIWETPRFLAIWVGWGSNSLGDVFGERGWVFRATRHGDLALKLECIHAATMIHEINLQFIAKPGLI